MGALGDLIRRLREERRLSQQALSARAGLTRAMISHIEVGRRRPTLSTLVRLARALGVPLSELVQALEEDLSSSTSMTFLDLLKELTHRDGVLIVQKGKLDFWPDWALADLSDALSFYGPVLKSLFEWVDHEVIAAKGLFDVYRLALQGGWTPPQP